MNTEKVVLLTAITEPKEAKDGRSFYSATFGNPLNPFAKEVTRNFWQQFKTDAVTGDKTPVWKGADPKMVKEFVGKTIPGYIKNNTVEEYEINIPGQPVRKATSYTTVILDGENEAAVFKSLQHPIATDASIPAAQPAIAAVPEAQPDVVIS